MLRCHSFSRSSRCRKNYTRIPMHIVATACLTAWCARENSLQLLEKSAPRVVAFIFHRFYPALFHLFFDIAASSWLLLYDTDFFFSFSTSSSFKSVVQDDERVFLSGTFSLENVVSPIELFAVSCILKYIETLPCSVKECDVWSQNQGIDPLHSCSTLMLNRTRYF